MFHEYGTSPEGRTHWQTRISSAIIPGTVVYTWYGRPSVPGAEEGALLAITANASLRVISSSKACVTVGGRVRQCS